MTAARRRFLIGAGIVTALAFGSGFYFRWRTHRALRGPFRIGFFRSGFDHFPGPDGKPQGATVEILNEAARRCGMKLQWVYSPEGTDAALEGGHVDLWPNLGDIPQRHGRVYITLGYNMAKYGLVSRRENPVTWGGRWPGMVVARGGQNLERMYAEKLFPSARFITATPRATSVPETDLYGAVCTKRADAAIISSTFAQFQRPPECRSEALHINDLPDSLVMFGIGASYKSRWAVQAADLLRDQLDDMVDDGTLDEIAFRWNFRSPTEVRIVFYMLRGQASTRHLRYAVGAAALILLLLVWLTLRLRAARRDALSASRSKSEFLANMSHEIRTPLNGVLGMTELALQTQLNVEQRDFLETARGSAESLLSIVNDILDFSKIEAGKMDLELLRIDLSEIVEFAAGAVVLKAHQKQIELAIDIAPECPRQFHGDPTRIRQVLTNLLGNAVKFTEHGEIVVRVAAVDAPARPALQFSVIDTGIGIPLDKQRTIFEAFSQADASTTRKYGGTGLGLTICRRIVDLMGGRFWVESEPGRGSAFHFTVPVPDLHAGEPETESPDLAVFAGARVLVADDNATNRGILERMLARRGFQVTGVATGEDALRALAGDPFRLAIVDYDMPGTNSLELVRRLPSVPIIMMLTPADWNITSARVREVGITTHVLKPVKPAALMEAIRKLLAPESTDLERLATICQPAQVSGLRILLAEDNAVNQRVGLMLLERSGHTVTVASNGREAVDLFDRQTFDLVLMDIQMPEMDGFEAAAAIRACEAARSRARVPIIALTAYAMRDDEVQLFAGMDAHLPKPIRSGDLNRTIARFAPTGAADPLAATTP